MDNKNLVPVQREGFKSDISSCVEFDNPEAAIAGYFDAKARLLNVSNWANICNLPSSDFRLTDKDGTETARHATTGDYIRINVPAPGNATGDGYDWVKIEAVEEDDPFITAMRVRPAANPGSDLNQTAHFFDRTATSTFIVRRDGQKLSAEVHGRNEQANTDTDNLGDKIRNTIITFGARLGFSGPQWKSLVEGLVNRKEG